MADDKDDPFREFDARMARMAPSRQSRNEDEDRPQTGTAHMGIHVGTEIVAGVIGGALMGYGIDYYFETSPLGLLVMLTLGSAAGMLNAYRYIQRLGAGDTEDENKGSDVSNGGSK